MPFKRRKPSELLRGTIQVGQYHLNLTRQELRVGQRKIQLNYIETKIMREFLRQPRTTLSVGHFMRKVWNLPANVEVSVWPVNSFQVYLHSLRKKVEPENRSKHANGRKGNYQVIKLTEHGMGLRVHGGYAFMTEGDMVELND